ncbi:MAG: hypothetical protein JWO31_1428, partial [Phycisphaerales bacterium]|nr:hypothetical protein [Phycisphaerales bacterium]
DVTADAKFDVSNPALAKVDGHTVRPAGDGAGSLAVTYGGKTVNVPLNVKAAAADRPISFRLDVMPVFLKAGCNTGGCHGSARGKDGFNLSLFGFDAAGDYDHITRAQTTRRINLAVPADSLLVTKAIGAVQHTGGQLFKPDSPLYATMMRWLEAGAPDDAADVAKPVALELFPKTIVLEGEGSAQQMVARAKYSDGTDRDVTNQVLFLSNNDSSAPIDQTGKVTAKSRGEAFVMARFATFTVGSQAVVIPKGQAYEWNNASEYNYIDGYVDAKLKKLRVLPSEVCSDETFVRRASLDIVGLLPTADESAAFVADADPKKREKLVDALLGRKEFVELWVMKFAELLKIRSQPNQDGLSYKSALLYFNWLQDQIANNVPMDQVVQQLLSATGGTFDNPPTNYYQAERDTLKVAEDTAQVFMGMRVQCAQCHNHPFDRWTQDDYYGFASFFSQVGRKQGEDPREQIVFNQNGGEVKHPLGRKSVPKFLGGDVPKIEPGQDRRAVLAKWLASPENPYFAKNLANIVWAHFLGKGIIEPVDDVRVSNPPVNPELLDALGTRFQEYKYDFRRLVRDICTSRTYQLATRANDTNATDVRNFAKGPIRRIRAEVLLDAIGQATETSEKFRGLPLGARAVQIADGDTSSYFLTTFGRAKRETVCSCEVAMEPNLSQALHLLNGQTTNARITQGGVVRKLFVDEKKTPEQVIEALYARTVSRKPTPEELSTLRAALPTGDPKKADVQQETAKVLEDVLWALLNSEEFMFNH